MSFDNADSSVSKVRIDTTDELSKIPEEDPDKRTESTFKLESTLTSQLTRINRDHVSIMHRQISQTSRR
jgi:hypothetical protein